MTTFLVPVVTKSETNMREHWAVRHLRRKTQRGASFLLARSQLHNCVLPANILLVRVAPRELDDDNLRGALKATRDGVSDALGVNDRDPRVTWLYGQRKGSKGQYGVEVSVWSADAA